MFSPTTLWRAPEVNSVNNKARSIPIFNLVNIYGRVFTLSWFGFFIAFWSWYAFPPLLTTTIRSDLQLSQADVAKSSIVSLVGTLVVRLLAGSACDRYGPRLVFVAILLAGAIPTALAGTVNSAAGLIVLRFFVGILGGSFIPCQVWTTAFFDKNVVGTANSLTAGFGNAGSGVTYFVMPAILDSLVARQHLTPHVAWRVAFVVPFILIVLVALVMLLFCPDTPTGPWSTRTRDLQRHLDMRDTFFATGGAREAGSNAGAGTTGLATTNKHHQAASMDSNSVSNDKLTVSGGDAYAAQSHEDDLLAAASWELVEKPTYHGTLSAILSLPTINLILFYTASFGTELAVAQIIGAYYYKNFPGLGQTGSGNWAAMYGLLNAVFRPAGGIMSDVIYRLTGSLWAKKLLVHFLGLMTGVFLLIIGLLDPSRLSVMIGLMTGLAFFDEAANGGCFSLAPHVHPTSNGEFCDL